VDSGPTFTSERREKKRSAEDPPARRRLRVIYGASMPISRPDLFTPKDKALQGTLAIIDIAPDVDANCGRNSPEISSNANKVECNLSIVYSTCPDLGLSETA